MLDLGGGPLNFRNAIINGNCRVGQYGNKAITNNAYTFGGADRIMAYPNSFSTATGTLQQMTSASGTTTGYAQQLVLTTTGTGSVIFATRLEAKDVARFAGRTVTISAKLYQDTGSTVASAVQLYKANALDNFSGVTQIGTTVASGNVPTSTWTTVSATIAVGSSDAANGMMVFWQFQSIGAVTAKNFIIGDLQMTEGLVVLPIDVPPITYDEMLCKRYLPAFVGPFAFPAWCSGATTGYAEVSFSVPARTAPTGATVTNATSANVYSSAAASISLTSLVFNSADIYHARLGFGVAAGLVGGNATSLQGNSGTTILFTGCEL